MSQPRCLWRNSAALRRAPVPLRACADVVLFRVSFTRGIILGSWDKYMTDWGRDVGYSLQTKMEVFWVFRDVHIKSIKLERWVQGIVGRK